jgi:hypothetical protein
MLLVPLTAPCLSIPCSFLSSALMLLVFIPSPRRASSTSPQISNFYSVQAQLKW